MVTPLWMVGRLRRACVVAVAKKLRQEEVAVVFVLAGLDFEQAALGTVLHRHGVGLAA